MYRIIVLLGQCNSQLERAQQAVNFNQQWESLLSVIHTSFENYQKQLIKIREEQTSLIHLDTIQVIDFWFELSNKTKIILIGYSAKSNRM